MYELTKKDQAILDVFKGSTTTIFATRDSIHEAFDSLLHVAEEFQLSAEVVEVMKGRLTTEYLILQNTLFNKVLSQVTEAIEAGEDHE